MSCFERAYALDGSLTVAAVNLANGLRDLGCLADAEAVLDGLLSAHADVPAAHNALGLVDQDYGRHEAAIAAFEQALALTPGYHEALNNMAISYQALGHHEDALMLYRGRD